MSKSYLYIGAVTGAYLLGLGLGIKLAKGYYAEKADREITETRLYLNDWYNEMPDPKSFHEEMSRQYGMSIDDAVNDILNDHQDSTAARYDIIDDHKDSTTARDETTDDIIAKLEEASVEGDGKISKWDYSHDYYDYTKTSIDLFPKVNIIKEDGIIIPESDWSYQSMKVRPQQLNSIFVPQVDAANCSVAFDQLLCNVNFQVYAVQNLDRNGLPY